MSLGPAYFTESKVFSTHALMDGVEIVISPSTLEKVPSEGAHVLEHVDGGRTLQLAFKDDTDPEGLGSYEFRFDQVARGETEWWHVERLWKKRASFYFIPWDQEEEVFAVGRSLTAFVLPRPTASSQSDHADVGEYVTRAWLDDVAQTPITTGTPGAGEVKIVGRDVTTPTLTAGQVLRIRYAPAYLVAVTAAGPQRLNAHNDLTRSLVLTEVREGA